MTNQLFSSFKHGVLALMLCASFATPSFAASCYDRNETVAEQAIRVHSELLVIAVSCADAYRRPDLFNDYVKFTNFFAKDMANYEKTITKKVASQHVFDEWRTMIANSVAARAAMMSTTDYCRHHVGTLAKAMSLPSFSKSGVETLLARIPEARENLSRPACSAGDRVASRAD